MEIDGAEMHLSANVSFVNNWAGKGGETGHDDLQVRRPRSQYAKKATGTVVPSTRPIHAVYPHMFDAPFVTRQHRTSSCPRLLSLCSLLVGIIVLLV